MRRQHCLAAVLVGKSILVREGLARILRSANFRILASVSCADDVRASKPNPHPLLFLIVHTGDDFDAALEQIELFRTRNPDGRIAVVADHYRLDQLASAFRAGANGYFVNVITCDRFIKSLELVMMGETIFPPAFLSFILDPEGGHLVEAAPNDGETILLTTEDAIAPPLSPREKLILGCLIEGNSNKFIARKIDIAEATVKVHVKAILRKIRVQNRTQAAIWAMNNGARARSESDSSLPSLSDMSERLIDSVEATSELKQIEAPAPLGIVGHEANHVEVARIERLSRTLPTARLSK
jgi:DNA-binding NarL/FixJ family response regulator